MEQTSRRGEEALRDNIYVVDGDGHVMDLAERCYRKYLPPALRERQAFYPSQGWDRLQAPWGPLGRAPATVAENLADNEQEGIDLQILYPTLGLNIGEVREPEYQAALCRAYNDWVADYCREAPEHLKAVAIVPVLDPTEACREMNRAVADLGLVGVMFPTYVRGHNVGEQFFWPIYSEAETLGVPVALHATGSETGDVGRFPNFLGVHVWSHAPEQMISLTSIILGGIPEQFPRLRLGFMESGCGWLPFWMEHLEGEWEKRRFDAPLCKEEPRVYMTSGRLFYSFEPEEKTLPYVAQWVGEDQLLYASDYPHWDSEWPDTTRTLLDRDDLSPALKRKLLCDNALRFYGIQAAVPTA
jgi:uncharacterized protein